LNVVSYHDTGVVVTIRASKRPLPGTNQNQTRTVKKKIKNLKIS
jgi:hypothetical protein